VSKKKLDRLERQNAELRAEVERLRGAHQHGEPAAPDLYAQKGGSPHAHSSTEGLNVEVDVEALRYGGGVGPGSPWSRNVPGKTLWSERRKAASEQPRPISSEFTRGGALSRQELAMWRKNLALQAGKWSSKKQAMLLREAMWDARTGQEACHTVSEKAFPPSMASRFGRFRTSKATVRPGTAPVHGPGGNRRPKRLGVAVLTKAQLIQTYCGVRAAAGELASGYAYGRRRAKGDKATGKQKKMKPRRKKGRKKVTHPAEQFEPELEAFAQQRSAERNGGQGNEGWNEQCSSGRSESSRTKDTGSSPPDWTQSPLFLRSREFLREASQEAADMEHLLVAIDAPERLEESFSIGCAKLEMLWTQVKTSNTVREKFREDHLGRCTAGNFAHVLSQVTRLTTLRNKLLHTFQLIKRRERLVDSLTKVMQCDSSAGEPQSLSEVTRAAESMMELRSLNDGLMDLIEEITRETGTPLILHGINYMQKIRYDFVLP